MPATLPKPSKKKTKNPGVPKAAPAEIRRYVSPQVAPGQPLPQWLAKKLAGLRRKYLVVHVAERLVLCCAVVLVLLGVQMVVDWLVGLHVVTRAVILCGDLALLGFFIRKRIQPLIFRPLNQEECALLVEKHWPTFRGRVIATVQFAKPRFTAGSQDLINALQKDTHSKTMSLNFGDIVSTRSLFRRVLVALIVAVAWAGLFIHTWPGSLALLERVVLIPAKLPRKTEVICLSGNQSIPEGTSVTLEARAVGIVPSHGRITLRYASGRIQEITMDPEAGHPDHFSIKVDKVEEEMTYTIQLNDGVSDSYEVTSIPRPEVKTIECEQVYPAYTGLATVKRSVTNLALLPGSRLEIHAVTNSKIKRATLKLIGLGKERPIAISGTDGTTLTGEIDIPPKGLTGFSIQLTNEAGVTSGDETQYRIDLIPDRPPTVQITEPERLQELTTLKGKPKIVFTANDDFGLAKVYLCYRVMKEQSGDQMDEISDQPDHPADQNTEQTPDQNADQNSGQPAVQDAPKAPPRPAAPDVEKVEIVLGEKLPLNLTREYSDWSMAALKPAVAEGTNLEFWIEVEDANNVTGPGKAESEHHIMKVVSPIEFQAAIMQQLNTKLQDIYLIQQDQEGASKALKGNIEAQPASK